MTSSLHLHWLPNVSDWRARLKELIDEPGRGWDSAVTLANSRLDFARTGALDSVLARLFAQTAPPISSTKPVRLAILSSSTTRHLLPSIRIGGVRRRLWITCYENNYGQYLQELLDTGSALHEFSPNTVLLALDAHHLTQGISARLSVEEVTRALDNTLTHLQQCWTLARDAFGCRVIQQTVVNVAPVIMGNNEQRLPGSRRRFIDRLNFEIRALADRENVDLLDVDAKVAEHGLFAWYDPALWHRSKQEVMPTSAPFYGDLLGRLLAAQQGRAAKCLVLDLDNTLWGGVIGDDGLDGIVLGQGSPMGEGFVALQDYVLELSSRGVILAVCSKNDESNAMEPFEKHPEMVLNRNHLAAFRANWHDKPSNLRAIAAELNIGLDALVFLDDNPFERNLVREELPMVAVPEVPDEPGEIPRILADAGYFEGLAITEEDRERTAQYLGNKAREAQRTAASDLNSYLAGLQMNMIWRPIDRIGLQRVVQLVNKTNQFNLTTRRYSESDVIGIISEPGTLALQLRLLDRFGDNGIIAVTIGRMQSNSDFLIDTWLMSCRVLGRQVEIATLNLLAAQARRLGAKRLIGEYVPTQKNSMVREHYTKLGFTVITQRDDGGILAELDLEEFVPKETFILLTESGQK